jgi:hypothetical protein
MSGLLRGLVFGDIGNWWHTLDVEGESINQRNKLRQALLENYAIDKDQEARIIQLEIVAGTLMAILKDNKLISDQDLERIIDTAETETGNIMTK